MGVYFSAIIHFIDSQLKGVFVKKKIFGFAMAVMLVSGAAMAQEVQKTEKAEPSLIEQTKNQAIYAKVGFPGVGLGYAYGVNKNWGKLDTAAATNGTTGQAELDKQVADLKKDSDKLRVVPQVFIGVAYKF